MFTSVDKLIAGFLGPIVTKGVLWVTTTLGMAAVSPEVNLGITAIITGALVYFIPNKLKS
jgi:hypothetical protein